MIVTGTVVAGHGVASGRSGDSRFPEGTLALQWPVFERRGLDLSGFCRGTINVSVNPLIPEPVSPLVTFRDVMWHPDFTEDFSFFDVRIATDRCDPLSAYIYWPHPETKPEHFQDIHVVEVLAPKMDGIAEGAAIQLWVEEGRMRFGR